MLAFEREFDLERIRVRLVGQHDLETGVLTPRWAVGGDCAEDRWFYGMDLVMTGDRPPADVAFEGCEEAVRQVAGEAWQVGQEKLCALFGVRWDQLSFGVLAQEGDLCLARPSFFHEIADTESHLLRRLADLVSMDGRGAALDAIRWYRRQAELDRPIDGVLRG